MGDIQISSTNLRTVEVGRVVRFAGGAYAGRLATIVEIIDHKRALVEGPSASKPVPRHAAALAHVSLTSIVIDKLPRGAGSAAVRSAWVKAEVDSKWSQTPQAKAADRQVKRSQLNDFQRFKLMRLQKRVATPYKVQAAKIRASA